MIVIYHEGCSDGLCAAALISIERKKMGCDNPTFIGCKAGEVENLDLSAYEPQAVLIVDLNCKRSVLNAWESKGFDVAMWDHHELREGVTFDEYSDVYDQSLSGATIVAKMYHVDSEVARYVQDRDLWEWKLPMSNEINAYLYTLPRTLEAWVDVVERWELFHKAQAISVGTVIVGIKKYHQVSDA